MKCKCGQTIHQVRIKAGYRSCVECSTEKRWGSIPVTYHKTGNTIEICKDPEVAERINAMAQRTGFGVMKGLTGNYRSARKDAPEPKILPDKPVKDREISRKTLPSDWDAVGKETLFIAENAGRDRALEHIEKALTQKRIFRKEAEQLIQIINHITKDEN